MKKYKYLITASLLLISSLILISTGLSYSIFNLQAKGATKNKITTASYTFLLSDDILNKNQLITATPNYTTPTNDTSGLYKTTNTTNGSPSYYFRGNVENNYVDFAGFTWRIVRINEDGTIRLILNEGINNDTKYKFNSDYTNYTYIYYSNSIAKTEVENWYNTNIATNPASSLIVSGNYFCEQAKVGLTTTASTFNNVTLAVLSTYTPKVTCATDKNGYGVINSSVGLITVDELMLSGLYPTKNNSAYYLYDEDQKFWTMSPAGTYREWIGNYPANATASEYYIVSFNSYLLRPVINLKADVQVSGKGTSDNHYIVK